MRQVRRVQARVDRTWKRETCRFKRNEKEDSEWKVKKERKRGNSCVRGIEIYIWKAGVIPKFLGRIGVRRCFCMFLKGVLPSKSQILGCFDDH